MYQLLAITVGCLCSYLNIVPQGKIDSAPIANKHLQQIVSKHSVVRQKA
jgi:hypothetical protein